MASWDWATISQVAVALMTGYLAFATYRMASGASAQAEASARQADASAEQAKAVATQAAAALRQADAVSAQVEATTHQAAATAELVEVARLDLAATATPQLVPISAVGEPTGGWSGEAHLTATLKNLGGANALYQSSTLSIGAASANGELLGAAPTIQPGEQLSLSFAGGKSSWPTNTSGVLQVLYEGPGSGVRRQVLVDVQWKNDHLYHLSTRQKDL